MVKVLNILTVSLLLLFLTACASTLNPYQGDFTCPQMEQGKCVPIQQAYVESTQQVTNNYPQGVKNTTKTFAQNFFPEQPVPEVYERYNDSFIKKLQQMLDSPKTPVLIPPTVIRVLVLPYSSSKDTFFAERYVYTIVEDPQWIFHNIYNVQEDSQN